MDNGTNLPDATREQLDLDVEEALAFGRWNGQTIKKLAGQYGVSVQTIMNARVRVLKEIVRAQAELGPTEWNAYLSSVLVRAIDACFTHKQMGNLNRIVQTLAGLTNAAPPPHLIVSGPDGGPVQVQAQHTIDAIVGQLPNLTQEQVDHLVESVGGALAAQSNNGDGRPHGGTIDATGATAAGLLAPGAAGGRVGSGPGDGAADPRGSARRGEGGADEAPE